MYLTLLYLITVSQLLYLNITHITLSHLIISHITISQLHYLTLLYLTLLYLTLSHITVSDITVSHTYGLPRSVTSFSYHHIPISLSTTTAVDRQLADTELSVCRCTLPTLVVARFMLDWSQKERLQSELRWGENLVVVRQESC